MSAVAAVSPLASSGGLTQHNTEDGRWGYIREDDDDSNSAFVFTQPHSQNPPQPSIDEPSNHHGRRLDNSSSWSQRPSTDRSDDTPALPQPLSNYSPNADATERSTRLDPPRHRVGELSRNGSEADSLLDLYKQQQAGLPTAHTGLTNGKMSSIGSDFEEVSRGRWIHRDKLAAIENEEARAAGVRIPPEFDVAPPTLNYGAEGSDDEVSGGVPLQHDMNDHLHQEQNAAGGRDGKRQRLRPQSPMGDQETESAEDFSYDLRTPEEIAADNAEAPRSAPMYHQHALRSSSSRIPLATSSPLPIPQQHLERSTPLPRKRGPSGNWEEDGIMYSKVRSRSHSVGSQVLLDDADHTNGTPASPSNGGSSPSKSKTPSKSHPTSGVKRPSNASRSTSATQKLRSTSTNARGSPAQRPPTRSGPDSRPSTAAEPKEGDPPWLATIYSPDPRLPPDQQIIPTHAKRILQEQWEKEGKVGSVFGRDFEPLAINTADPHPSALNSNGTGVPKLRDDANEWPLRTPPPESHKPMKLPGIGSEHAGYSTIPRVQSTPSIAAMPSPRLPQPMEVHQPIEREEDKEKGCGCCIVM